MGELGMHPWEFSRYIMSDFISKLQGAREYEDKQSRERWEIARSIAFYNATMQGKVLKSKNTTPQAFWPLPWDEKKGVSALGKEDRKAAIKELRDKYLRAAKISKN